MSTCQGRAPGGGWVAARASRGTCRLPCLIASSGSSVPRASPIAARRRVAVVDVEEREAVGVLGVGAAQQSGQRGLREVGTVGLRHGERGVGDDHQP